MGRCGFDYQSPSLQSGGHLEGAAEKGPRMPYERRETQEDAGSGTGTIYVGANGRGTPYFTVGCTTLGCTPIACTEQYRTVHLRRHGERMGETRGGHRGYIGSLPIYGLWSSSSDASSWGESEHAGPQGTRNRDRGHVMAPSRAGTRRASGEIEACLYMQIATGDWPIMFSMVSARRLGPARGA